jgi:hypothetical protein
MKNPVSRDKKLTAQQGHKQESRWLKMAVWFPH